jgi:DNA-binding beta-propeller fold protein YncE
VIKGGTNATTTLTDPEAKKPDALALNPGSNKIYVANSGSNNVSVIDGTNE